MSRSVFPSLVAVFAFAFAPALRAEDPKPAEAKPADVTPSDQPAAAEPGGAKPADAKPADAKPEAKSAEVAAEGKLSVASAPPGKVFLDGTDTGLTTPVLDLPVAAGKHTLKVVDEASKQEATTEFTLEAGGSLNLSMTLSGAAAPATTEQPSETTPATAEPPVAEVPPAAPGWTWMTVTGWSGVGLGVIGILAGAVVLTTPSDPQQGPLGFTLFGTGAGLLLGGAVLLYLDTELADSAAAPAPAPASAPESAAPAAPQS